MKISKLAAAITVVAASTAAQAQQENREGIEEIFVTSQKRAESISVQDVSSAITAFSGTAIENSFSADLTDIGRMVPNAVLNNVGTFNSYPNFFIRGIGVNGSTRSMDPAVGIIVDGVYLGYPAGSLLTTFDRESIEVLRGPQGTLLGRNVTGGAVNVRSRRPDGDFRVKAEASIGNYDMREIAFSVEGALGQNVAAKLAIVDAYRDGYFEDNNGGSVNTAINPAGMPNTPAHDKSQSNYTMVRPVLHFTPTENLDITLIGEYLRDRGGSASSQNIVNPGAPKLAQTLFGYTPPADKFEINHDLANDSDVKIKSLVSEINWDIGHGVVTSVSGWRDVQYNTSTDFDGSPFPIFAFPDNQEDQDQFSQELRYASQFSDTFDFVAGLYYFDQNYTVGERRQILGTVNVAGVTEIGHENMSAFGETNIHLNDKWTLVAGLRYTKEKKDIEYSPPGVCALDFSSCSSIFVANDKWDNVSPKVALQYAIAEDMMVYASWTKGFRSGAYNARAVSLATLGPADEETVESYELGFKSTLLDGTTRFNAAVFRMDYTDIQQFLNRPDPVVGANLLLINAAEATVQGFEAELNVRLDSGWSLDANVGYVDAEFDSFIDFDANGDGAVTDADTALADTLANTLEFVKVPEWTYNLALGYEFDVGSMGSIRLRGAYSWMSSYYTDFLNDPFLEQGSYGLLDASVTYVNAEGNLKVSLFGKNLREEEYFDYAANVATLDSARWGGVPRTWGIRVAYEY